MSSMRHPAHRLALVGAFMGLAPALALGAMRVVLSGPPMLWEELPGNLAFALLYASPYLIALYGIRGAPKRSGALLMTATLLSFAASFSALSGISLLLLPATVALAWATIRAYRTARRGFAGSVMSTLGAAIVVVATGAAFFLLFRRDDPRCSEFTKYADGRTVWRSVPVTISEEFPPLTPPTRTECWVSSRSSRCSTGPPPPGSISQGTHCTSDIITYKEGLTSLGLLALGLFGVGFLSRIGGHGSTDKGPDVQTV